MKKGKVRVSFDVEIEMDDEAFERRHFIIEENDCPGTGKVGLAVRELVEKNYESGTCLICAANGENKIIEEEGNDKG